MPDAASIPAVPLALPTSVNTIEEEAEMEEAMDVEGGFDDRPPARPTRSRSPKVTPRPSRESLQIEDAETCRPPRPASPGSTMTPALGGRPSRNSLDTEWLLSGHQHERQRYRSQSPIIGRGPGARGRSVSFHDGISVGDIESDSAGAKAVDAAQAAWKKRRAMYFVVYSA